MLVRHYALSFIRPKVFDHIQKMGYRSGLYSQGDSQEVIQNTAMQTPELFWTLMRRERPLEEQSRFCFD